MSSVPAVISTDRFDQLFQDPIYLEFKEHLYSYLRRRDEILRAAENAEGPIVEIGSGTCPIVRKARDVIHSDVSEEAIRQLKSRGNTSPLSVFSADQIPLATEEVGTAICSEVLEHIDEDQKALAEIARILRPNGVLILTVPVHAYFYMYDDSFVGHRRRYRVADLLASLGKLGFSEFEVVKIAGPSEKLTTLITVRVFELIQGRTKVRSSSGLARAALPVFKLANRICSKWIGWEAKLLPIALSTIILVRCRKIRGRSTRSPNSPQSAFQ